VAPVALNLLDNFLTAWGQPAEYWAGDYRQGGDSNPILDWFMKQHTLGLAAQTILWIAFYSSLIVILPGRLARVLALAVAMGHATGAGSWLVSGQDNYWIYPVLYLTSAALIVLTWEWAEPNKGGGAGGTPTVGRAFQPDFRSKESG
jgi:hypothetical protein